MSIEALRLNMFANLEALLCKHANQIRVRNGWLEIGTLRELPTCRVWNWFGLFPLK